MKTYKYTFLFCLLAFVRLSHGQLLADRPVSLNLDRAWNASISEYQLKEKKEKNPHKATLLATFLPGSGQIYNEKYWKVPIVYAGLGVSAYAIIWNRREMKKYQDELDFRAFHEDTMSVNFLNLTVSQLKSNRDFYRANRDISIISLIGIYALQIVDAAVDAHLSGFKVDENLSMNIKPLSFGRQTMGLGITLTF